MHNSFKKIDGLLKNILNEHNLKNIIKNEQTILLWDKIVGEKIAQIAKPIKIEKGILFLKTKNSIWRQELFLKQSELISKINNSKYSNKINQIKFL